MRVASLMDATEPVTPISKLSLLVAVDVYDGLVLLV